MELLENNIQISKNKTIKLLDNIIKNVLIFQNLLSGENNKFINLSENLQNLFIENKKEYYDRLNNVLPEVYYFDLSLESQLKEIKKIYNEYKESSKIKKNKEKVSVEKIGKLNLIYLSAIDYPSKSQKLFIDDQKRIFPNKSIIILVSADKYKVSIRRKFHTEST